MSETENKTLLKNYFTEVWEKKNPDAVRQFLSHEYKRHTSPNTQPLTLEDQIQRLIGFRTAFPDIQIIIDEVIAEGSYISFRSTMNGTHQGSFAGIAPTGKTVTVTLIDIIRIENGKITEQWGGPDMYDLVSQLNAKPD